MSKTPENDIVAAHPGNLPGVELHEQDGRKMLIGDIGYQDILYYFENWREADEAVHLDEVLINRVKQINEPIEVICYLGTWCSDSREGVPVFVRTLQQAANPDIQLKLIAVNRQKDEPESALANNIERVPTFLLLQNGEEFARLVEFPIQENFVQDFVEIMGK